MFGKDKDGPSLSIFIRSSFESMEEAILSDVRWPLSVLELESKEQVDNRGPSLNAKIGVIETVLLNLPVSSDIESDWISDEVIDLALWFGSNILKLENKDWTGVYLRASLRSLTESWSDSKAKQR